MALWDIDGEIVFSEGPLTIDTAEALFVTKHTYNVPYSNIHVNGFKGSILTTPTGTFHTPSWIEVHPQTTLEDIEIEKNLFEELFIVEKNWKIKSSTGDKEYTVKYNKHGELSCDCWGYIGHKKCKHITEVKAKI
jgi:hypothetical protein